jgi:hypothetical protein
MPNFVIRESGLPGGRVNTTRGRLGRSGSGVFTGATLPPDAIEVVTTQRSTALGLRALRCIEQMLAVVQHHEHLTVADQVRQGVYRQRARVGSFDVVLRDTTRQFRLMSCSTSGASRFSMAVTAPARSLWFCS